MIEGDNKRDRRIGTILIVVMIASLLWNCASLALLAYFIGKGGIL